MSLDYREAVAPGADAAVIGCGAMGRGIAQLLAQAGLAVRLSDAQPGAAEAARSAIVADLAKLVARGRITAAEADGVAARLHPAAGIAELARCTFVIEAVVEDLEAKR